MQICDFGSARKYYHTTNKTILGTYPWTAPEVSIISLPKKLRAWVRSQLSFTSTPDLEWYTSNIFSLSTWNGNTTSFLHYCSWNAVHNTTGNKLVISIIFLASFYTLVILIYC